MPAVPCTAVTTDTSLTSSSTNGAKSAAPLTASIPKPTTQRKAKKKLTYTKAETISPLQSYISQQKNLIEEQYSKVRTIEKDLQDFSRERTLSTALQNCALPCCSKCHLREGHNRLNCPYPNPCSSAKYCGNIDKHPDEKQVLKEKNKKLSEEQKSLKSMKEELENRQRASENVAQRYAVRVRETLTESDPDKYTRYVGGKMIEDWRLINKDSKILEKHFKSKIPSPEEARTVIQTFDSNSTQQKPMGKTSVHNPYKMLWTSRGVSWPKPKTETMTRRELHDKQEHTSTRTLAHVDEDNIRSPQRKKAAVEEDDYQLALGIQESLKTLPETFDLMEFESVVDERTDERSSAECSTSLELATQASTSLDILAEAALSIGEIVTYFIILYSTILAILRSNVEL